MKYTYRYIIINRLWNEIITGRQYFNISQIANDYAKTLAKDELLKFFDRMVEAKLSKLSVQEFSHKGSKKLPTDKPTVRGFKSELIDNFDYLRVKNKFLDSHNKE
jgi:secreted Zn-dependent insulinase-like peptidase